MKVLMLLLVAMFFSGFSYADDIPIRWTKHINIKSLDEIDNALDNYIDEYAGGEHQLTLTTNNGDERKVTTCKQYKDLQSKGYYPATNWDILYQFRFTEGCTSLELIKKTKPSKTSYIQNFDLTNNPLENLPPTLDLINTGGEIEKAEQAIKQGKTWKEYDPTSTFKTDDEQKIHIESQQIDANNGNDIYITLQAWGDFNNDTIEDVLLLVTYYIKGATYRSSEHVLLTRLEENGPLILGD
ncbi:MAG: hypothetical protein KAS05_01980 [Candidatus Omnitrophica bacterium]|nr:hypothetical protein [Candidatus Omnitrophota bacterium]